MFKTLDGCGQRDVHASHDNERGTPLLKEIHVKLALRREKDRRQVIGGAEQTK